MSRKLTSYQIALQAKALLKKLDQVSQEHIKEAIIADHMDMLCAISSKYGYEIQELGWTGITESLYSEGALK